MTEPPAGYKLARLAPGLWLQLSDDGRTLFRLVRYREDGDAEWGDGRPVIGWFWRAERLVGDVDDDRNTLVERDPDGRIAAWDADALAADSSAVPWDHWWWINLRTRREAVEKARAYDTESGQSRRPEPSVVEDTLDDGRLFARRPRRPEEG